LLEAGVEGKFTGADDQLAHASCSRSEIDPVVTSPTDGLGNLSPRIDIACRRTIWLPAAQEKHRGNPKVAVKNVIGIDHAVVMSRALDKAAENWKRLGFALSPRGTHSAHMGTGNYTMMLDPDYIELLGVLAPTEHNAPARAMLEKHEGIERVAFTAVDAAAGAEEIRSRGYPPLGPTDFERPVTMPNGTLSTAKLLTCQ